MDHIYFVQYFTVVEKNPNSPLPKRVENEICCFECTICISKMLDFFSIFFGPRLETGGTYRISPVRACVCARRLFSKMALRIFLKLGMKLGIHRGFFSCFSHCMNFESVLAIILRTCSEMCTKFAILV